MSRFAAKAIATGLIVNTVMVASVANAALPDAVKGEAIFSAKCSGCHSDVNAQNGVGPFLYGVYGRTAGTAPGYSYSAALKASKIVWTKPKLTKWLEKPTALVPGTNMTFAPPTSADEKADIIAYLKSKK